MDKKDTIVFKNNDMVILLTKINKWIKDNFFTSIESLTIEKGNSEWIATLIIWR